MTLPTSHALIVERSMNQISSDLHLEHSKFLQQLGVAEEQEKPHIVKQYLLARFDVLAGGYWPVIQNKDGLSDYERFLQRSIADEIEPLISKYAMIFDDGAFSISARTLVYAHKSYYLGHAIKARLSVEKQPVPQRAGSNTQAAKSWGELEILFLSKDLVELKLPGSREHKNYAEMGFEDRRKRGRRAETSPNQAWAFLAILAREGGVLNVSRTAGKQRPLVEKKVQQIKKVLKARFNIPGEPLRYNRGTGYSAAFRISIGPSFDNH